MAGSDSLTLAVRICHDCTESEEKRTAGQVISLAGRGREFLLHSNRGPAYPPHRLAEDVLDGVQRNRPVIVAPARARVAWLVNRLAPWLIERRHGMSLHTFSHFAC